MARMGARKIQSYQLGLPPSKSFTPGVQETQTATFDDFSSTQADYTFTSGVNDGSPTQWSMQMNAANNISPGDSFSFGYDFGGTATFFFVIDGSGSGSGIQVNLSSGDGSTQVAEAVQAVNTIPGLSQSGDMLYYTGSVFESQSLPSGFGYASLMTISSGSPAPGNVATLQFSCNTAGVETTFYLWAAYAGGSDPGGSGSGIQVALSGNYSAAGLASAFASAVTGSVYTGNLTAALFGASYETLRLAGVENGAASAGSVTSGFVTHSQVTLGSSLAGWPNPRYIKASDLFTGETFLVYVAVSGDATAPAVADHEAECAVTASDSGTTITQTLATAFQSFGAGFNAGSSGTTLSLQNPIIGDAPALTGTTPPFTFATSIVGSKLFDLTANTLTLTAHGYSTGTKVRLVSTGSLPTGLSTGTDYWLIRTNANTLKFASSYANAQSATAIDLTSLAGVGAAITIRPV